ncbi:18S rRNA maturation protein [Malassezia yamatoensis]|uniref:rRNA-processing protein EFG1 n=1 Tax=Malassezia yamatoensis TaxID=253288 RepID=A0AAJ5YTN2_9BASI|nr:18S rRNA maturation protein [Malassezia yamatoensis]
MAMKPRGASQESHLPNYKQRRADGADKPTGVNKIKNALRQTKRLLAKESLAPGARIEAERRLKALERELEEKQHAGKERSRANRYHKVKFFERQKIHRKIRKLKRSLEEDSNDKQLRRELAEARVFLHYIMTFPQEQRYVALFADKSSEPKAPDGDAPDRAHQKAAEFLNSVRKAVKKGTLSKEPEVQLEEREQASRQNIIDKGTKRQAQDKAGKGSEAGLSKQPKHSAKSVSHKAYQEEMDPVSDEIQEDASDTEKEMSDSHTSSQASSDSSDTEQESDSESSDENSSGSSDKAILKPLAKASQRHVDRRKKVASEMKHTGSASSNARASKQKQGIAGDDFFAA